MSQRNQTVASVKIHKYVSFWLSKEFFVIQNFCSQILIIIIRKIIHIIIAHHIVGVQALSLCNFENSVAFQTRASSLICFQSFNLFKKSI